MRTLAGVAAVVLAISGVAHAQDGAPSDEAKRDALVASDWFKKGNWTSELDKAKADAKKTGKVIFVYFTVTDQESPFCRNIEKTLLPDERFVEWSKKFVPYCQITYSKKNTLDELHRAQGKHWPWFAFLDSTGALLFALRPTMAQKGFEEAGERVLSYLELSRKAQKGGDAEKRDLVIAALDIRKIKSDDARARLEKLGELTEAQKKALAQAETNAFVSELAMATDPNDKPAVIEAGRKFVAHKKSGQPLPTFRSDIQSYWLAIMKLAVEEKDAALYEEAYLAMKERYGSEATTKTFFEGCARTLDELKAAKK